MSEQVMQRDAIQSELDKKARRKDTLGRFLPYLGFVFLFVFFLIVTKGMLVSRTNLLNLVNQCFTLTVISMGGAFVYAHGGSDMSIAATCGCAQLIAAVLLTQIGLPLWICIIAAIAVAVVGACMTASVNLVFGVPVFIGSMCIRSVFSGILSTATKGTKIFVSQSTYGYMNNVFAKLIMLIFLALVGYYLFEYTALGKRDKAIGGNEQTARQAGINTKRVKLWAFIILGVCVGIAAIFQMFRSGEVTAQSGTGLEFNMMLAVVLGGFPMRGGEKGRFVSAIIGALTVALLENGLVLWGLDPNLVYGIKGILFVAIVGLTYDKSLGKLVS